MHTIADFQWSADRSIASGWIRVEDEPGHDRLIITMINRFAISLCDTSGKLVRGFHADLLADHRPTCRFERVEASRHAG